MINITEKKMHKLKKILLNLLLYAYILISLINKAARIGIKIHELMRSRSENEIKFIIKPKPFIIKYEL